MTTPINDTMSRFEDYKNMDEETYTSYVDTVESQPYKDALQSIQLTWENNKMFGINTIMNYSFSDVTDKNFVEKYGEFTAKASQELKNNYEGLLSAVMTSINTSLDNPSLKEQERIILESEVERIKDEYNDLIEEFMTVYNSRTEELINLPKTPTGMFIIAHENFSEQLERMNDLDELNSYWSGYESVYNSAINALEGMLSIAQSLQTPKATSALNYYYSALSSSKNALTRKASSKRAKMCSGNGWVWWIIVIILILCMLGLAFYCNGGKKSGRKN